MSKRFRFPILAAIAFVGALVASPAMTGAVVYVQVAPPPPLVEVKIAAPGHGYVWVGGFHRWSGNAYAWVPGRWARPPRAGVIWAPGHWKHGGHGWHWVDGRWK
jgi:hypothetical protein